MASIALDLHGDCVNDIAEHSPPRDAFGESDIMPRMGDEYYAELPPVIDKSDYMSRPDQKFSIGLPIPVTWIRCDGPEIVSDARHPDLKIGKAAYSNGEIKLSCELSKPLLVPGLLGEKCWSDDEKATFLVGLYIFQKNFVEVRRFMETKEMGEILSFYYGRFYGSDKYKRWSECRNTKSKKRVCGQRIFSGLRQQELLSRLLSRLSEERRNSLLEVSKTFVDEKMSLVDYVSSLKSMVGMSILVEAIGIGTGSKRDLTRMVLEPSKSNQTIPLRPEIPMGKACSSLTTAEIIKFLSGGYRLSKARSNDLFWEAVWPRLLARGWHSEEPKNPGYVAGSKHCLVFLKPGVKRFSRKLVRGDRYFDSVTDVLSEVAREPGLIELGNEDDKNGEHELIRERKLEEENVLPTAQRRSYLQPRTHNCSMDAIKFMVVDTSLRDGKVRELRTLLSETLLIPLHRNEDILEEKTGVIVCDASVKENPTAKSGRNPGRKKRDEPLASGSKNKKDRNDNEKNGKVLKPQPSQKQKRGNLDYTAPISKHCKRYTANSHDQETRDGVISPSTVIPGSENAMSCRCPVQKFDENLSFQVSSCQDKLSSTSSSESSPSESNKHMPVENAHASEPSTEDPQPRFLIDLNLPQVPPDFDNGVFITDVRREVDNNLSTMPDDRSLPPKSSDMVEVRSDQDSIVNPQRHSRRNRPLTNRALEAIADGYLTVNRKIRKGRDAGSLEDLASPRPSQRARGVLAPIEEAENAASNLPEEPVPTSR